MDDDTRAPKEAQKSATATVTATATATDAEAEIPMSAVRCLLSRVEQQQQERDTHCAGENNGWRPRGAS